MMTKSFFRKRLLFLFFLLSVKPYASFSQKLSPIGTISDAELEMKLCPFDPDAAAVYLLYEASSDYDDSYRLFTEVHIRMKILKEKAIDEANVTIPFYSKDDFEYIDRIEGLVANPVPNSSPAISYLDKKSVFEKKVNQYYSEKRLAFPSVKVGSIIDYYYRSIKKSYSGLDSWYFQQSYPMVNSRYNLVILPGFEFAYQVVKSPDYNIEIKPNSSDGSVFFSMKNIPGLQSEPYMDAPRDYLQRVEFELAKTARGQKYHSSWDEVARDMYTDRYFGKQIFDKLPGTEGFIKSLDTCSSEFQKMHFVYDYVRSNMTWNGLDSKYTGDGIKKAWDKKSGTSGELNLILMNLLDKAGLDVSPVLISERYHGRVYAETPFVDQFNTVYALVKIKDDSYYLDATNKTTYPGIIPYDILNTTGLIINKKGGQIVQINDKRFLYEDISNVSVNVDKDATASGNCILNCYQYSKADRLRAYRKDKTKYQAENFKNIPGVELKNIETRNDDTDSLPMIHTFDFSFPLPVTGSYYFVPTSIFNGISPDNPFVSNNRFTDINFGYNQKFSSLVTIHIPGEFVVDAMPKSVKLTTTDQSILFTRIVQKDPADEHSIIVQVTLEYKRSLFDAGEYLVVKEFYKKLYDALNEQIVLKKKES